MGICLAFLSRLGTYYEENEHSNCNCCGADKGEGTTHVRPHCTRNSTSEQCAYTLAGCVKLWDGAGISLKHFFNGSNNAGELIGYFYKHGFRLTGLYEIHGDINGAQGLK